MSAERAILPACMTRLRGWRAGRRAARHAAGTSPAPAIIPQRHRVARSCTIPELAIANARLRGEGDMRRSSKNSAVEDAHAHFKGRRKRRLRGAGLCRGLAFAGLAMVVSSGGAVRRLDTRRQGIYPGDPDAGRLQAARRLRSRHPAADVLQENRDADRRRAAGVGARRLRRTAQPLVRRSLPVRRRWLYRRRSSPARRAKAARCCCSRTSLRSTVLGEAWGALRFAGQTITGYRQLIDRPFINTRDNREIPQTFEAYS